MTLKFLVPFGLLTMVVCMSCSPSSSPQLQNNDVQTTSAPAAETPEATWGDNMTYGYLFEREADTKAAMAVVKATLGSRQKAHIRDMIGNLAFVEIITLPDPDTRGGIDAPSQHVAVILGEKPRLLNLPDKALFAHFAKNIRLNPDLIDSGNRIWTALVLATGMSGLVHKPEPATWTDKNGTLVIHCFRHIPDPDIDDLMLQECTLTVDVNQDYTLECIDHGPPSE